MRYAGMFYLARKTKNKLVAQRTIELFYDNSGMLVDSFGHRFELTTHFFNNLRVVLYTN